MHKYGDKNGCINPDITLIFDVPADVSLNRAKTRGETVECFENLEFLKKARDWHLKVAKYLEKKGRKIIIVNANQTKEEVTKEMLQKVEKAINELNSK